MGYEFERIANNGNVLLKNGSVIEKTFPPDTHVYAKPATDNVIVFSENADQRIADGDFELNVNSVSVPSHTGRNDLLRKLAEGYFYGSVTEFGDNASDALVPVNDTSATVISANASRKQIIITNKSQRSVWLRYGASPAVFGEGVELVKREVLIEGVYRGEIRAIMEAGQSGELAVTEVTT